jgi:energy-coupling factor transporter ATP-binding protein EcfA2
MVPLLLAPAFIGIDLARRYTVGEAGCRMSILALGNTSLRVERGAVTLVTGASELARTALLQIAAGLLRPDAGVAAWPAVDDDPRCAVPRFVDARELRGAIATPRVPACPSLLVIDGLTRAAIAASGRALRRTIHTALAFDAGVLLGAAHPDLVRDLVPAGAMTVVTLRPPAPARADLVHRVAEPRTAAMEHHRPA